MIGAVLLLGLFHLTGPKIPAAVSAVPVQIVSDVVVAGGPGEFTPDPPAEEVPPPPAETPPVPVPPTPTPTPRPPEKPRTPQPTPTPRPPTPTPPRPPRPPAQEPGLNLADLRNNNPPRPPRPPSGGGGDANSPPRPPAGPVWSAIFNQVYRNWSPPCDTPGVADLRIQMDVTLTPDGRIAREPVLLERRSDPVWIAVADGAKRALYQSAPFDVPRGFTGGTARTTFLTSRICGH